MPYVVGSAEIEVVPSTKGFDEKLDAQLAALNPRIDVGLRPDVLGMKAELDAAVATEKPEITVPVKPDVAPMYANLDYQLRGVRLALKDIRAKLKWDPDLPALKADLAVAQATMDELKIHVGLDDADFLKVKTELATLTSAVGSGTSIPVGGGGAGLAPGAAGAAGGSPLIAGIAAGVAVLGGPLVTLLVTTTGIASAMGLMFGAAAGGITIFALLAKEALSTDAAFKAQLQPSLNTLQSAFDMLVQKNSGAILAPLQAGIKLLVSIMPLLTPIIQAVSGAILQMLKPIQQAVSDGSFAKWVGQFASLIGPGISGFSKIAGDVVGFLLKLGEALKPVGVTILDDLVKAAGNLSKGHGIQDFANYVKQNLPATITFFTLLFQIVQEVIGGFMQIGPTVLPIINGLIQTIELILPAVTNTLQFVLNLVLVWPAQLTQALGKIIAVWLKAGGDWLTGLGKGIAAGYLTVDAWLQALPGRVEAFFAGAGRWLLSAGLSLLTGLGTGVLNGWGTVNSWFGGTPGRILAFFAGAGRWLLSAGQQIVGGLWSGLEGAWNGLTHWISQQVNAIPAGIRSALGIHSPSTVMAEIGMYMGQGLQQGLSQSIGTAMNAANLQIGSSTRAITATATTAVSAQINATPVTGASASNANLLQLIVNLLQALLAKTPNAGDIALANRTQIWKGAV